MLSLASGTVMSLQVNLQVLLQAQWWGEAGPKVGMNIPGGIVSLRCCLNAIADRTSSLVFPLSPSAKCFQFITLSH